ncbi:M23 family metallopeptidase [Pseudoxanthomonas koreensis]|uniref:M23 family metallopeptidase n=1 Tax=Pseudoxanthomonas koreensis TaxID=266061 RepID=UPI001391C6CB|nr:M23 family metallopeptidase [Pseudoxanthomonas koreensis]KAF1696638.1 peptidase [Pseudoxanthomonas koreensis]
MHCARATGCLLAAALAVAAAIPAEAARVWPRPHAQATPAPADRPPAPAVEGARAICRPVSGDPVALRLQPRGSHYDVVAENRAPGPVQVELSLRGAGNFKPVPALPARRVVGAGASEVVARVYALDPRLADAFEAVLEQVPGDPRARPSDFAYRVPFEHGRVRVDQAFGGRFSHDDAQNFYALDFALPEGTPVLAARGGTVLQVQADFQRGGLDPERDGGRANHVRILHDDGSMALYGHLQPDGVQVRVGDRVVQGQRIGLSGNTGFSTAPHLHFVVQVNAGMRLQAIPVRMFGAQGELKFAREADGAGR